MSSIFLPTLKEWHNWLQQNHASAKEVWLIFYKKHTGKASLNYEETVEEALCYGWIDSLIKKLDEERYARKFTPRINFSKWSDSNINRMNKLIGTGRMKPEGLRTITQEILASRPQEKSKELEVPSYIKDKLSSIPAAACNFEDLSPSHKKRYIGWIDSAKKKETKLRRLEEAVKMLIRNERLGLK